MSHIPTNTTLAQALFKVLDAIEAQIGISPIAFQAMLTDDEEVDIDKNMWRFPATHIYVKWCNSGDIWLSLDPYSWSNIVWSVPVPGDPKSRPAAVAFSEEVRWSQLNYLVERYYAAGNVEKWLDRMGQRRLFGPGCGSAEFEGDDWRAQVKSRLRDRPDWCHSILNFHLGWTHHDR